jgi:hypothetical protein
LANQKVWSRSICNWDDSDPHFTFRDKFRSSRSEAPRRPCAREPSRSARTFPGGRISNSGEFPRARDHFGPHKPKNRPQRTRPRSSRRREVRNREDRPNPQSRRGDGDLDANTENSAGFTRRSRAARSTASAVQLKVKRAAPRQRMRTRRPL